MGGDCDCITVSHFQRGDSTVATSVSLPVACRRCLTDTWAMQETPPAGSLGSQWPVTGSLSPKLKNRTSQRPLKGRCADVVQDDL